MFIGFIQSQASNFWGNLKGGYTPEALSQIGPKVVIPNTFHTIKDTPSYLWKHLFNRKALGSHDNGKQSAHEWYKLVLNQAEKKKNANQKNFFQAGHDWLQSHFNKEVARLGTTDNTFNIEPDLMKKLGVTKQPDGTFNKKHKEIILNHKAAEATIGAARMNSFFAFQNLFQVANIGKEAVLGIFDGDRRGDHIGNALDSGISLLAYSVFGGWAGTVATMAYSFVGSGLVKGLFSNMFNSKAAKKQDDALKQMEATKNLRNPEMASAQMQAIAQNLAPQPPNYPVGAQMATASQS